MIPKGWKESTVGKVCQIKNNLRLPISEEERAKMKGPFPYIGPTGILDYINEFRIDEEFVTIGEDGDHFLKYKEKEMTFYYNEKSNVNNHAHIICNSESCLAKWFGLFFQHRDITSFITRQGAKRYKLTKDALERLPILLPPLAEQKKIAEILSTWDEAISVVDKQLENCRLQKKALMQQLLTGKKRLPGFSGEWRERKISEIASVNPENLANSTRNDYRFNYISLDDVTEGNLTGVTQQTFASSPSRARRIIQQGDVLVAMVRPNLKSHLLIRDKVEDFICSTGFCVVRPREGVLSQYIYHQFFGDIVNAQIEGLITGSNYPAINSYDVENIMIPLPSDIQEQKAIVNVLDGYESSLKKLAAKRNLLVLEKKSLMQQLLTGKKRVAVEE